MRRTPRGGPPEVPRHGLARVLSRRGLCSRSEAARWIAAGRVAVDGRVVRDPEWPVAGVLPAITIDGRAPVLPARRCIALNKPRGLVTTVSDEQGRATVYRCLDDPGLPWLAPVGRLDRASEGLLLFSNDPAWAACVTDPRTGPDKTYHVQVDVLPDDDLPARLRAGLDAGGEPLRARSARWLRAGTRNAWLEVVLDEGRNRHVRRLLAAAGIGVLRLVRVSIGDVALGDLPKGRWRDLTDAEVAALAGPARGDGAA